MLEKSMSTGLSNSSRRRWQTRPTKYSELTKAQQLQDDCDVQGTNIILRGLLLDVYSLVNNQETTKDVWDRVKLLIKGTELSYQERECRLYNLFDKFASVQGETLYEYYWRFYQLINYMHTIGMTIQQIQVNTKFLNALRPEWSKFVTDVKLAKSLYTTNYDQFTYSSSTPSHSSQSTTIISFPQPFISLSVTQQSQAKFPQLDSGLVVPTFKQGEDLIDWINKAMAFLSAMASRFPSSNNQLKMSSNSRNQATIQDGRVTVQQVQRRQTQSFVGTRNRGIATTSRGNYTAGQVKVVKCYNYLGEGYMAKQCTQPKRPRSSAWFKEKLMLVEAQEAAFQTEDLDAYDSDCDDISSAKAILMANLSSCDSDLLFKVPYSDTYTNDMINQDMQEMSYSEQTHIVDFPDNEMTNDSNIIPYSQYFQESQDAAI
ncbi:hypothetical protein Tco_0380938 [Tanacetum coccineum]